MHDQPAASALPLINSRQSARGMRLLRQLEMHVTQIPRLPAIPERNWKGPLLREAIVAVALPITGG
jgi:hypothetical protein